MEGRSLHSVIDWDGSSSCLRSCLIANQMAKDPWMIQHNDPVTLQIFGFVLVESFKRLSRSIVNADKAVVVVSAALMAE